MPSYDTLIEQLKNWQARHDSDSDPHEGVYLLKSDGDAIIDQLAWIRKRLAALTGDLWIEPDDIETQDTLKNHERSSD